MGWQRTLITIALVVILLVAVLGTQAYLRRRRQRRLANDPQFAAAQRQRQERAGATAIRWEDGLLIEAPVARVRELVQESGADSELSLTVRPFRQWSQVAAARRGTTAAALGAWQGIYVLLRREAKQRQWRASTMKVRYTTAGTLEPERG